MLTRSSVQTPFRIGTYWWQPIDSIRPTAFGVLARSSAITSATWSAVARHWTLVNTPVGLRPPSDMSLSGSCQ